MQSARRSGGNLETAMPGGAGEGVTVTGVSGEVGWAHRFSLQAELWNGREGADAGAELAIRRIDFILRRRSYAVGQCGIWHSWAACTGSGTLCLRPCRSGSTAHFSGGVVHKDMRCEPRLTRVLSDEVG